MTAHVSLLLVTDAWTPPVFLLAYRQELVPFTGDSFTVEALWELAGRDEASFRLGSQLNSPSTAYWHG
jgi:hypothetical protein